MSVLSNEMPPTTISGIVLADVIDSYSYAGCRVGEGTSSIEYLVVVVVVVVAIQYARENLHLLP